MDNSDVYRHLEAHNIWERNALLFAEKYGRPPGGKDIYNSMDSEPLSELVKERIDWIHNKLEENEGSYLNYHETDSFLSVSNIELSKVERFIDQTPHTHEFFEVECVLHGACLHTVENQPIAVRAGDMIIVPPRVSHKTSPEPDCVMINLKIRKRTFDQAFINLLSTSNELSSYLARTLYSESYRSSFTFHCGNDLFVKELLLSMYGQQLEEKPYFNYVLEGMTLTLFSYMIQNHSHNIEISNFVSAGDQRMSQIIAYIHENYRTVTLKSLARQFYISEPYLSLIIKKETGSTFSSLLQEIKIQKASVLLLTTDFKIDIVCEQAGYKDTTQFIKTFKNYHGLSPRQYRQNARMA